MTAGGSRWTKKSSPPTSSNASSHSWHRVESSAIAPNRTRKISHRGGRITSSMHWVRQSQSKIQEEGESISHSVGEMSSQTLTNDRPGRTHALHDPRRSDLWTTVISTNPQYNANRRILEMGEASWPMEKNAPRNVITTGSTFAGSIETECGADDNIQRESPTKLVYSEHWTRQSHYQQTSGRRLESFAVTDQDKTIPASTTNKKPICRFSSTTTVKKRHQQRTGASNPIIKRIKIVDSDVSGIPVQQLDHENECRETTKLTDCCYRKKHGTLVRVAPSAASRICPAIAQGLSCTKEHCFFRHDLDQASAMPVCMFFQRQGMCFRENCKYRHVKVNRDATPCPKYTTLGYCDDASCTLLHVRRPVPAVCQPSL